ncbi:MAG: penicillin-binding protein 2 [Patescibacteria group bacterium]|nr:penicillin-binding protein 2 [Patescibacteria group bacterium]
MRLKKLALPFIVYLYFFFFLIINIVLIYYLYQLQVVKAISFSFTGNLERVAPLRGNIYLVDKEGKKILAATSLYLYDLYFYPPQAKNIIEELRLINAQIKISNFEKILATATASKNSILLAKKISYEQKKALEKIGLSSIFFEEKVVRYYPLGNMLSTVIGFATFDDKSGLLKGQYGLERYYDSVLKGEVGYRDKSRIIKNAQKGNDLVLNIDYYVQKKSEEILDKALEKYRAKGGLIIVVDSKRGDIIAVAERPNYDPNRYFDYEDYSIFVSRLSTNYEPGSVLKPFYYAAAFYENLAIPSTTYYDAGHVNLNGWRIENFDKKGRGEIDLKTALEQSLNTGSVYISQLLGKARFLKYTDLFRLNIPAEVDFPILEKPNFSNLQPPQGREVNFGTASFGQGIALSPLNLVQGFLAFANNGDILKLNFAKEIIYFDESVEKIKPKKISTVLDKRTFDLISPILEGVVINQAKKARILGYSIGGKTGSALIPNPEKTIQSDSGYSDEAITNFIGFFPLTNPQFLVLVRLDRPDKGLLAFGTAAPTFREVSQFLINYYGLEPDKPEELIN